MSVIRRDVLPAPLEEVLKENKVTGTIAVQVDQSISETQFLLDLAEDFDFIKGVVGWVDLRSDHLETQLDALAHQYKLVGFRHIVQAEQDPMFLMQPAFRRGLEIIFERGYTYDILIYPHQLAAALELIDRFPRAPFVIDHLAKPYIKSGYYKNWEIMTREISQYQQVYCNWWGMMTEANWSSCKPNDVRKYLDITKDGIKEDRMMREISQYTEMYFRWSGMITEANWYSWTPEDLRKYLEITADCFTADRLMYRSDWPVLNVAETYQQVLDVILDHVSGWSTQEQSNIMGENAKKFYLSKSEV